MSHPWFFGVLELEGIVCRDQNIAGRRLESQLYRGKSLLVHRLRPDAAGHQRALATGSFLRSPLGALLVGGGKEERPGTGHKEIRTIHATSHTEQPLYCGYSR